MNLVHRSAAPVGEEEDAPSLTTAWVSNDEANRRLAFVQLPASPPIPTVRATSGCSTSPSSAWELHKRAYASEFAPPQPFDPGEPRETARADSRWGSEISVAGNSSGFMIVSV